MIQPSCTEHVPSTCPLHRSILPGLLRNSGTRSSCQGNPGIPWGGDWLKPTKMSSPYGSPNDIYKPPERRVYIIRPYLRENPMVNDGVMKPTLVVWRSKKNPAKKQSQNPLFWRVQSLILRVCSKNDHVGDFLVGNAFLGNETSWSLWRFILSYIKYTYVCISTVYLPSPTSQENFHEENLQHLCGYPLWRGREA